KSVDHHAGKARADHSAAEAQNIGIVVQTGEFSAEAVGAAGSADAFDLVCSHRDADAGAADENAHLALAADDLVAGSLGDVWIVHRVFVVAADVDKFNAAFLQMFVDLLFEQETAVVASNNQHGKKPPRIINESSISLIFPVAA